MVTIINTMEVRDFNSWKDQFEKGAENRTKAGINIINVYADVENANKVSVISEVVDAETGRAFIANLKTSLSNHVIIGEPQITMLNKIM